MFAICPDKMKALAVLKAIDTASLTKFQKSIVENAVQYMAITCILRPRSKLQPKFRNLLHYTVEQILEYLPTCNTKVSAYDRLRVMREHVKHMEGYLLPSTTELTRMYNDMNIPPYPMDDINQIPNERQRAILITAGIAEVDMSYDSSKKLAPDQLHDTVDIAISLLKNKMAHCNNEVHFEIMDASLHRIITTAILRPNEPVCGYLMRALNGKSVKDSIDVLREFASRASGHDVAKVMAIHASMSTGYFTPTARTHRTEVLQTLSYSVSDFLTERYPLTAITRIPTKEQLEWQLKYGYAQKHIQSTAIKLAMVSSKG